jgi:WD40 repeat protein
MADDEREYDSLQLRISPRSGAEYGVQAVAPDGTTASGRFTVPFDDQELQIFVLQVGRRRRVRAYRSTQMEEAKQFGAKLFDAVIAGDVRDLYASVRRTAEQHDRGVRVTLYLTEAPALMRVPWEYLYERPSFLAQSVYTPVVRSLDLERVRPPRNVVPPLRVLGVISQPRGFEILDADRERETLLGALGELERARLVELQWLQHATLAELDAHLSAAGDVHVLHYIGHGAYDERAECGVLVLEDALGAPHEVTCEELGSMIQDERSLQLVVLNSCEGARASLDDPFSAVASGLIEYQIPAVIGMQFEITDEAAITFASRLYAALARGLTVDAALAQARRAIFAAGNGTEFGTPVLYLRSGDGRLFDVDRFVEPPPPPPPDDGRAPPTDEAGELHGVPALPDVFVPRDEVDRLRAAVVAPGGGLGLHGEGGIGKSVLAAALARDDTVRRSFPDGIFWVALGEGGDLVAAQIDLLEHLGMPRPDLRSASEGLVSLREAMAERRCLLVIDDVRSTAAADAFRAAGPGGRVLYTTREPAVLAHSAATLEEIHALPDRAARLLLETLTRVERLPDEAESILEATGRVPLAVALVGAAFAGGRRTWHELADELDRGGAAFSGHPYANVFKAMEVGIASLADADLELYRSLAVFPEDTPIPVAAVRRLWTRRGDDEQQTTARLETLAARRLITWEGESIGFHDLQREFLLLHTRRLGLLHADLLAAYRALLPREDSRWSELPVGEPYIWEHLLYHLRGAGDNAGFVTVATDLAYLAVRSHRGEPHLAEADLRDAATLDPEAPQIRWLLRLFTQWAHLLADHANIDELAATLACRTYLAPFSLGQTGLAALLAPVFVAAEWGLPDVPRALIRVLEAGSGVSRVAFSPDGRRIAAAAYDRVVRVWDPATGVGTAALEHHARFPFGHATHALAYSPDGSLLACVDSDRGVRLWDPDLDVLVATLQEPLHPAGGGFAGVAFSPDGTLVAGPSHDGGARLWDVATFRPIAALEGHDALGLAFAPDGRHLATVGLESTVLVWDVAASAARLTLHGHTGWVARVMFSPDGDLLASAGEDGTVRLWDVVSGVPGAVLVGHTEWINDLAFSPDGRLLASAGNDMSVRLWDIATRQLLAVLEGHTDSVQAVAFSPPDGRRLASVSKDRTVRLWDPTDGDAIVAHQGHTGWVWAVAFSPDGRQLATAGDDGTVRLWNPRKAKSPSVLEGYTRVNDVACSSDGRRLASAGDDGKARLSEAATGNPTAILDSDMDRVLAVAFSPNGGELASAGTDGAVLLWKVDPGELTATLDGGPGDVEGLAFSRDGRRLAAARKDILQLWDVDFREVASALEHPFVRAVAFSPVADQLASVGSREREVRLWDAATGRLIALLDCEDENADRVTWNPLHRLLASVAFSPDGRFLAATSRDRVHVWDVGGLSGRRRRSRYERPLATLATDAEAELVGVGFSPDGRHLVSASKEGTLLLWDAHMRALSRRMRLGVSVWSLAWGPSGITVGAETGVVQLTVIEPGLG